MNFKLEKDFQSWINKQLRSTGSFVYKMSDGSIGKKPYDCYWVINHERHIPEIACLTKYGQGVTVHCELKMIDGYTLNYNKFEPQQIESLTRIVRMGGGHSVALALVYSKKLKRWISLEWESLYPLLFEKGSVQIFEKS